METLQPAVPLLSMRDAPILKRAKANFAILIKSEINIAACSNIYSALMCAVLMTSAHFLNSFFTKTTAS